MHGSTAGLIRIQLLGEKRVERLPVIRSSKKRAKQSISEGSAFELSSLSQARREGDDASQVASAVMRNVRTTPPARGETNVGSAILRVKPRGCEPCVLAAFFESGKLGVVLIYEGFSVGWDGPAKNGLGGFLQASEDATRRIKGGDERTYSKARSRAMPYLR